jgi:hypothetical protein
MINIIFHKSRIMYLCFKVFLLFHSKEGVIYRFFYFITQNKYKFEVNLRSILNFNFNHLSQLLINYINSN